MRWISFIIVLFFLPSFNGFSQDERIIDSIEKILPSSKGNLRVDLLNQLAWELKYIDPRRTFSLAEEAFQLAEKSDYNLGIALSFRNKAGVRIVEGDFTAAEPYAKQALLFIEKTDNFYQKGKILNLLAIISREKMSFKQALSYQNQALAIFRNLKDTAEIAGNLNNLGLIYDKLRNKEEALKLYLEVFDVEQKRGNLTGVARTSNNIGTLYEDIGMYEKAIELFQLGIEVSGSINNKQFEAANYHSLGNVYLKSNQPEKAITAYNKAASINKEQGFADFLANNYFQIAATNERLGRFSVSLEFYRKAAAIFDSLSGRRDYISAINGISVQERKLGNYREALKIALKALALSDSINDFEIRGNVYQNLYRIYAETGNPALALKYLEKSNETSDSLQLTNNIRLLKEIETRYEVEKMESDNQKLLEESNLKSSIIRFQRQITIALVVIFVIILVTAILLLRSRRKLSKVNFMLNEINKEIELKAIELTQANATKDRLFSIIAHDIRNPFSALLNFSELLEEEIETADKETLKFYSENIHLAAVNTFNLLDNLLYWSKSQRGAIEINKEPVDLSLLIKEVFKTAQAGATEKSVTFESKVLPDTSVVVDKTLTRIIIGNLVGNAVKFNNTGGSVVVDSSVLDNRIEISVTDTGPGIDPSLINSIFDKEESMPHGSTGKKNGTGLGLVLCRDFVRKMGGNISVESKKGEGSVFKFWLPASEGFHPEP
ncbi:MAG: tetratricopeptide repeat protein [Lentimicrobium sp.]|nr:tetratricopeptide repeat protein [Lentimicrobium sp.]